METHLEIATEVIANGGILNEIDPDELAEIMEQTQIEDKDAAKLASTVIYIRKRFIEKKSRYESFQVAFPERCILSTDTRDVPYPNTTGRVSRTAIEIKAKRLEQSRIYKKTVGLLQTNLYISYAMSRMHVLDIALDKITDHSVGDRDKVGYMKVFLEETRKPEESKGLEMNVNLTNNDVTLVSIEEKLSEISSGMSGKSAEEVIDMIAPKKV